LQCINRNLTHSPGTGIPIQGLNDHLPHRPNVIKLRFQETKTNAFHRPELRFNCKLIQNLWAVGLKLILTP